MHCKQDRRAKYIRPYQETINLNLNIILSLRRVVLPTCAPTYIQIFILLQNQIKPINLHHNWLYLYITNRRKLQIHINQKEKEKKNKQIINNSLTGQFENKINEGSVRLSKNTIIKEKLLILYPLLWIFSLKQQPSKHYN